MNHASAATLFALSSVSCGPSSEPAVSVGEVLHVHLGAADDSDFELLRAAFASANPGYDVALHQDAGELGASPSARVLFVQEARDASAAIGDERSELEVGDLILLRAGRALELGGAPTLLAFAVPEPFPDELPAFVRPEHDPLVEDAPGGCATGDDAYRRILLTWRAEVGPYVYHGLNAHRVRIDDSFSHYHPLKGGFDELYLVQTTTPDARVLTNENVARLEDPAAGMTREEARELLTNRPLRAGDLVYLPRGTMHRGLGGMMVQVISVPGFVPQAEIGVDHHLKRINDELELEGEAALPLHVAAADRAVVK